MNRQKTNLEFMQTKKFYEWNGEQAKESEEHQHRQTAQENLQKNTPAVVQ